MNSQLFKRCAMGLIWVVLITLISGCGGGGGKHGPDGPTVEPGTITIDYDSPVNIAPTFYGQNYWDWAYTGIKGTETTMAALHVNTYRAGGTCNDWHNDGHTWGQPEVDQYIAYCRAIGNAEPLLSVSVVDGTPQQAADMVRYCNITKGYNVKYWIIGNEPEYYNQKISGYDIYDYNTAFKNYVAAMKAVDPNIKIIGPETGDLSLMAPFLSDCRNEVDIVSFHHYPFGNAGDFTITNVLGDNHTTLDKINYVRNVMRSYSVSKPLAITEIHTSYSSVMNEEASAETFYSGLWIADNIGVGLKQNLWTMNLWGTNGGYGTGFLNPDKTPRPSYYCMQMFTEHFGKRLINAYSIAGVSAYASRNDANNCTILIVVNKTNSVQNDTLTFRGFSTNLADRSYSFPARSLTCLSIPDNGGPMEVWSYTKNLADKNAPPSRVQ